MVAFVLLSGCVADASVQHRVTSAANAPSAAAAPSVPAPVLARGAANAATSVRGNIPAPADLKAAITTLGRNFKGTAAISVRRVDADWDIAYNGAMPMPQQSVSKLWVSMALLDAVDRGKLTMKDAVTLGKDDLTLFHQPLAAMVAKGPYTTDLSDLFTRAMQQSDNTANDALLRKVGGPAAVRSFLARRFIPNIRFGPGERLLQSKTAGLVWDQKLSLGRNFYSARANLPRSVREKALDDYLANPPDGAAASSITLALAKLKRGEMLSPASTSYLLSTMAGAKTGPQRIKGGVPAGWSYAHKTGTGQDLPPRSTGYNDVGIMTAPDGTSYAVAVMIGSTTVSIPERWELMQGVARAVVASHNGLK
ncbi:MAG: serine hydrolase [Sphingobium sp.]